MAWININQIGYIDGCDFNFEQFEKLSKNAKTLFSLMGAINFNKSQNRLKFCRDWSIKFSVSEVLELQRYFANHERFDVCLMFDDFIGIKHLASAYKIIYE